MTEESSAELSEDERYRYELMRSWGSGLRCTFVMLNPSTADAEVNDATINRCRGFAQFTGHTGFWVLNLYALRSRDPKALWDHPDPVGERNDHHLRLAARRAQTEGGVVIAAWGATRPSGAARVFGHRNRMAAVAEIFDGDLWCFGTTAHNYPRHPLYLRNGTPLERWTPR